ncbi:MAG: CRISPR-associated helicase Cas3' [Verrucomicrobiales bacterium]|nr:CRISPR-associated helicase Cas3' [Verrucomicrobiales bacterium]
MNSNQLLAHRDQSLVEHLVGVACRARIAGRSFQGEQHAELAGLLHDLGKAEAEFQKRIRKAAGLTKQDGEKQPHAHHGAALLLDARRGGPVWPVAFAINAHHAGLHDRSNLQKRANMKDKALVAEKQLVGDPDWNGTPWPISHFGKNLPDWLDTLPFATPDERATKLRAVDLYTRFLFSALVDADRLDTEQQAEETKANFSKRHNWRFGQDGLAANEAPQNLLSLLDGAIQQRKEAAKSRGASDDVLDVRAKVLEACDSAAGKPRGVFTLTVPTGGGKTLASVYFALKHIAAQNREQTGPHRKLRRIIVVIPFLNIIQQTVGELRGVFQHSESDPVVLEHHSQAQDPETPSGKQAEKGDSDDYSRARTLRQLAAENWDAPIVVTTSVQFFDSLFSRRPADARKLHNIAQSVVIFDEVQTFPPRLMQPILDVLGELTNPQRPYGCSLVLCTATQPALLKSDDLPCGFGRVEDIIRQPGQFFLRLKRTTYPELDSTNPIPQLKWPELAAEVLKSPSTQGLVVINTRRHARTLFDELRKSESRKDAVFHLSTWMTPAHRGEVLAEVRRRLDANEPCFLVSTQCIEAGVDVDFPAVWRALGPYDAIVQAAGRCNRNGRLKPEEAQVHVFRTEDDKLPPGVYQTATSQTELLRKMAAANPHDPHSFETYFRLLYQLSVPDDCEIQKHREQLRFEEVSKLFKFIESFTVPIIVAEYNLADGRIAIREMCEQATREGFLTPAEWQQVQPHIVQLDYRDKRTARFNHVATAKMFSNDDDVTGLRRLTHFSAYEGGLHGCGLDVDQVGSFETVL